MAQTREIHRLPDGGALEQLLPEAGVLLDLSGVEPLFRRETQAVAVLAGAAHQHEHARTGEEVHARPGPPDAEHPVLGGEDVEAVGGTPGSHALRQFSPEHPAGGEAAHERIVGAGRWSGADVDAPLAWLRG